MPTLRPSMVYFGQRAAVKGGISSTDNLQDLTGVFAGRGLQGPAWPRHPEGLAFVFHLSSLCEICKWWALMHMPGPDVTVPVVVTKGILTPSPAQRPPLGERMDTQSGPFPLVCNEKEQGKMEATWGLCQGQTRPGCTAVSVALQHSHLDEGTRASLKACVLLSSLPHH